MGVTTGPAGGGGASAGRNLSGAVTATAVDAVRAGRTLSGTVSATAGTSGRWPGVGVAVLDATLVRSLVRVGWRGLAWLTRDAAPAAGREAVAEGVRVGGTAGGPVVGGGGSMTEVRMPGQLSLCIGDEAIPINKRYFDDASKVVPLENYYDVIGHGGLNTIGIADKQPLTAKQLADMISRCPGLQAGAAGTTTVLLDRRQREDGLRPSTCG